MCVYLFKLEFSFPSDVYGKVELLGHMVLLLLVFQGNFIMFPTSAAPIYNSTNSVQMIPFLPIQTAFLICGLFDDSHSDKCEVIYYCGFDLHFCDDRWRWVSLHVPVGHLYVFFGKNAQFSSLPIFIWIVWFFELYELFIKFGY